MARVTRQVSRRSPRSTGAERKQEPDQPATPDLPLLRLQRLAGNAAVVATVQRRTEPGDGQSTGGVLPSHGGGQGTPPAKAKGLATGVAEHLMTDEEIAATPSTADTATLKAEYQQIQDARKARVTAADAAAKAGQPFDPKDKEYTAAEQKRLAEIDALMVLRRRRDEDATLTANGVAGGHRAWFAEVTSTTFMKHDIVCHRLLAERLKLAEDILNKLPVPSGGWFTSAHSLRKVGESLHSFGLALDIDGGRNPYLVNPTAPNAGRVERSDRSRSISEIIHRALLLVEGQTPAQADFHSRPTNPDKDQRAMASYDKLQTASSALATYFTLDAADSRATLDTKIAALAGKDTRTADTWTKQIKADRRVLGGLADTKDWSQPQTGFLHLKRELVSALTSSQGGGLTWLGDDTIGSGRDIMHFDMRGLGPIKKIVKTIENNTIGLGNG